MAGLTSTAKGALLGRIQGKSGAPFTAISTAFAVFKVLRVLSGSQPKTVYKHKLAKGDVLVIRQPGEAPKKS
jgi:hypothetical protein